MTTCPCVGHEMLGSSLAVGAVCCARHHLAFTLRAVLRELFTISVCVRFADRHFSVPTGFINRWPVFMLPSSRNCYATTGLEGSVCVWGLRPMPTTKGAPSSHASLTPLLRIHEHVPPMPSCAQVPLPSATHPRYRRYLPPALPPLPPALPLLLASSSQRPLLPPSRVPVATAAAATTAALAPLAAAADRHGCSATSGLTYCRCLCCVAVPPSPLPSAGMSCAAVCDTRRDR